MCATDSIRSVCGGMSGGTLYGFTALEPLGNSSRMARPGMSCGIDEHHCTHPLTHGSLYTSCRHVSWMNHWTTDALSLSLRKLCVISCHLLLVNSQVVVVTWSSVMLLVQS